MKTSDEEDECILLDLVVAEEEKCHYYQSYVVCVELLACLPRDDWYDAEVVTTTPNDDALKNDSRDMKAT
jgi:hypothetical protein